MSVLNWTDLPSIITPDFVSHTGDYDYPLYLSEKKEWIHLKKYDGCKGKITICEPFMIMELNRFVPFLENNLIKFHPLNMPNIRIGKSEIVGFVVGVSEDARFFMYQVDDGSGAITVFYEKKKFTRDGQVRKQIDEKYKRCAEKINIKLLRSQECPKRFPNPRPQFRYPRGTSVRDMAILEHNWSLETDDGSLGGYIQRCNYVHAVGYCTLDFMFETRPQEEITFKNISTAKLNFLATKVTRLDESKYNAKLQLWMNTAVRRRYDESYKA